MELMGMSGRIFSGLMISMFFALAMVLLGVVAMLIRRWRQLTFWCNAPFALLFCYHFFLPESPRWLVSVGRFDEAKKTLEQIAALNQKKVDVDELMDKLRNSRRTSVVAEDVNRHSVFDLFRTPNLRKKTILVTISGTSEMSARYLEACVDGEAEETDEEVEEEEEKRESGDDHVPSTTATPQLESPVKDEATDVLAFKWRALGAAADRERVRARGKNLVEVNRLEHAIDTTFASVQKSGSTLRHATDALYALEATLSTLRYNAENGGV